MLNSRQRRKREAEVHNKALHAPLPKRKRKTSGSVPLAMALGFALAQP